MLRTTRNQSRSGLWKHRKTLQSTVAAAILFAWGFFLLLPAGVFKDRDALRVWFFDVGQGDAIFIETPDGFQLLIDGGPDRSVLTKLGEVMWPWDRTLDAVLLTHPDIDHLAGVVDVLSRYHVQTFYETGVRKRTDGVRALEKQIQETSVPQHRLKSGDTIRAGELVLDVLFPDEDLQGVFEQNPNRYSIILRLTYGETSLLLTGDSTAQEEQSYGPRAGDVDVLKIGHHGSLTSSAVEFIRTVQPEYAVISVGKKNTYGHPHPVILRRLQDAGVPIFRTDEDGDILLISRKGEPSLRAGFLTF